MDSDVDPPHPDILTSSKHTGSPMGSADMITNVFIGPPLAPSSPNLSMRLDWRPKAAAMTSPCHRANEKPFDDRQCAWTIPLWTEVSGARHCTRPTNVCSGGFSSRLYAGLLKDFMPLSRWRHITANRYSARSHQDPHEYCTPGSPMH